MTTSDLATLAPPRPRRQVLHLPRRPDLERRPAGRHAAEADPADVERWLAEGIALAQGEDAAYCHGRRCGCGCRPAAAPAEVAS